jgi:chromosome segregation ATPase
LENENNVLQGKLASANVNLVELERKLERAKGQIADLQKEHAQLVKKLNSKDAVIKDLNTTAQQADRALRISHAATNSLLLEFLSTLSEVQVLLTV